MKNYFFLILVGLTTMMISCKHENNTDDKIDPPKFLGKVTYSISLFSEDSSLLSNIKPFMADKVEVFYGDGKFRMIEYGGASHGNIIVLKNRQEAWQLDTATRIAYLSEYSDLNEPGEELMDMLPDHFAPSLQFMNEEEMIMNYSCKKYKITRSGFIPAADEAYIWVTEEFAFPSARFDVESEINHVIVPLPLYIGFEDGAILKLAVSNKNYSAIYEVVVLDKNADEKVFSVPEGYSKK